ncbi:MAG: DEAD/DEAH box helicase [Candidatus Heimdallarchaeota archaeon]
MDILHTIWDTNQLHIWSELIENTQDNSQNITVNHSQRERKHPFTGSFSQILNVLKQIKVKPTVTEDIATNWLVLNIPTLKNRPIPSETRRIAEPNEITLDYWQVNSLTPRIYNVIDFYSSLTDNPTDVVYSDSIKYWREVVKLALDILKQGAYIPSVSIANRNEHQVVFQGKWKALIVGANRSRFNDLVEIMPNYCQATTTKQLLPEDLVLSFVNQVIDSFLRKKLTVFIPHSNLPENEFIAEITNAWFSSLYEQDPKNLTYPAEKFNFFFGMIKAWLKGFQQYGFYSNFKTCFKLEPPTEEENQWKLDIYLQNETDPNLIIPAEDVWKYQTDTIDFLEMRYENPQERLIADLAKAADIYHKLSDSLEHTFPVGISLTKDEAFSFLNRYSEELDSNGFGILLPSWWNQPENGISIDLLPEDNDSKEKTSYNMFTMCSLVNFDWRIAIGDLQLTPHEFEQLSYLKVPFVKLRGKWVRLNLDELEDALSFFEEYYGNLQLRDILQMEADEEFAEDILPSVTIDKNAIYMDKIQRVIKKSKLEMLDSPESFHGELRPYQVTGFSWLDYLRNVGFGACLADDMGLGKTIQVIAMLLHEIETYNEVEPKQPSIIICPTSIIGNWYKELERFAPSMSAYIHHGPSRVNGYEFELVAQNHDVIITTYNLANRDFSTISRLNWANIILDEAQNIKNPDSKQARTIKKMHGSNKIALTGTPIENRLLELWSIFDFLNPGYLGTRSEFSEKYVTPIEKNQNEQKSKRLARLIQPFILRRLKTDPEIIKDLPEKIESKVYCSLSEEQAILYEAVVKHLIKSLDEVDGIARKGIILSALTKLKQICNHPSHFNHDFSKELANRSGKFDRLTEMVEEVLSNKEKVLIFTQYTEFGEALQYWLQDRFEQKVLFLHGGVPQKQREVLIQEFQDEKMAANIFILSIKAGGVGLNLTAANHVFHVDRWWNPSVENQATDRAYRIGQEKNVFVYKFISNGTLEENIDKLIDEKRRLADTIISTGGNFVTELSTDQLRELISLKKII